MNPPVNILVDTNVVLDFALERDEHFEMADRIMLEVVRDHVVAYVSASQITDIYYFIRKERPHKVALNMIAMLIESIHVIGVDKSTIQRALQSPMEDFEDAVQAAAVEKFGIDIVVTRDKTGFADSGLTVLSPTEFVERLEET